MFCLCSLLILTITLTSLTHPARPRRPLWFPGRMRNAQARHVMTSGSGDSGDVSSKTPRERNIWNEWKLHGNYMETLWNFGKMIITCYHNYVIRCDTLWYVVMVWVLRQAMPWHALTQAPAVVPLSLPSNSGRTWPASSTHEDNLAAHSESHSG